MEQEHIWNLLARKMAGEASEQELQELYELLKENPGLHYSLEVIDNAGKRSGPEREEAEQAYKRMLQKMEKLGMDIPAVQAKATRKRSPQKQVWKKKRSGSAPSLLITGAMLKNNFKTGWRSLLRNKTFSLINVTGLAIGMAAAVLIILWIQHELGFDRFHKNKDRIYQVLNRTMVNGEVQVWDGTSSLLASELQLHYPEVEATARLNRVGAFVFHAGDKHLESHGMITDPGFLKIFDFPLVQGDANTALSSTRSLVITESFAEKLFGDENAMGKVVRIDSNALFKVTGIMKDLPDNTTFRLEYLVPWSYMKEVHWDRPEWNSSDIGTFVLLKPGVKESAANARFMNIVKSHTDNANTELFLHPLTKWRLWSHFENGKIAGGYIETLRLFGIIAAFILLIACINYMNLSTARSVKRAKEVGIRKVAGAGKRSLVGQFLSEAVLVALMAGVLALAIAEAGMGWFNALTGKALTVPYDNGHFWLGATGFIVLTGILAGSYPAFYLSAFQPIKVLKGTFKAVHALVTPRKVLVVVQFTFAIILIICTIVIYRQIEYGKDRHTGYNKDNLAFVYIKGEMQRHYTVLSRELINSGAITSITRTNSPITDIWNNDNSYEWAGKAPDAPQTTFVKYYTDNDFAKTMGLELVAGRDINIVDYPTDSTAILINESAAKMLGFKDPVGQLIKNNEATWYIVGVVKDFIAGPYAPLFPTVIQGPGANYYYGTMTFRLNDKKATTGNLEKIRTILKKYNPDYPNDYYFVDESHAVKFSGAQRTGKLAAVFAGITIFISCLGLFALAAYLAESRTREIGIRKVLGASVATITTLLSKDFLKLVIVSFIIASPIAGWAMHNWLQHYAYHISIGWWVFAFVGLLSVIITLMTVGYQSIRAALANPVAALRSE